MEVIRPALLWAVLDRIPDAQPLTVEFKQNNPELISKVKALLLEHGRLDNGSTCWFSLDHKTNKALRASCGSVPTIVSVKEMLIVYMLYYSGLLPFVPIPADVFGFPADKVDAARINKNLGGKLPASLAKLLERVVGGDPPKAFASAVLVKHLRARGKTVQLLGINSEDKLAVAVQLGVTAILTDRPVWMARMEREGKLHLPDIS